MFKIKKNCLNDYIITLGSSLLISIFTFLLFKIILIEFGDKALSQLAIIKRYQNILLPVFLLGLGVMIPKKIASSELTTIELRYLIYAAFFTYLIILITSRILNFQDVYITSKYSFGAFSASLIFAIYRGGKNFSKAAIFNILFLIILPLVSLLFSKNLDQFIQTYLIVSAAITGICFITIKFDLKVDKKKNDHKRIFLLSISRIPGDIFNQLIFIVPIFLIQDNLIAGYISLAISIILASTIPLKPISTILLVEYSSTKNNVISHKHLVVGFIYSGVIALIYYFSCQLINNFYFNTPEFLRYLTSLTPSVLLINLYIPIRSAIDSISDKPLLSYINGVAIFATLIIIYFDPNKITLAINIGNALLCTASYLYIYVYNRKCK